MQVLHNAIHKFPALILICSGLFEQDLYWPDCFCCWLSHLQVIIRDLDPKSISTQELYGYVNMSTREWKDGLLSYNMRELANVPDDNPKWILLDGDLDANWYVHIL